MLSKNIRITNRELLDFIATQPCIVCNRPGPSDPSHIKTQGSGGPDTWWNVVPKCRLHHVEWGQSRNLFRDRYPEFDHYLICIGWIQLGHNLIHPLLRNS